MFRHCPWKEFYVIADTCEALTLDALCVHEEVVHGPVGFDTVLADEAGELGVVTYAMQESVEEDGLAVGAELAHGAGRELYRFVPVDVGGEELLEYFRRAVVGGVDGFYGVEWDVGIVGDGETGEAFAVAELYGDDVLEEFGDGLCACDVAGLREEFGVMDEELPPACGGLFIPCEKFFGAEDRLGHICS